jgi:secondary thiamine-phosphate synthase enzyme
MRIFIQTISVSSKRETDLMNITGSIRKVITDSKIKNGIVNILVQHTTAGLYINEDEPDLRQDVENLMEKFVPKGMGYQHDRRDENAHSHLRSMFLGSSVTLPLGNGAMPLGTWQNIMCIDFDGPRSRKIVVQVLGE